MAARTRSNLESPKSIVTPIDLSALDRWLHREADAVENEAIRNVVLSVVEHLDHFVRWPDAALLLWRGRAREKYHTFPEYIKNYAKTRQIRGLDGRSNGPAIVAFRVAGGIRPKRFGSNNNWSVHHLYAGKFPYLAHDTTLHAVKHGSHFTQSAGLVAIHPVADHMCDEFPFFSWLLRAKAYLKFGYDPDHVFSEDGHDEFGFFGKTTSVLSAHRTDG